MPVLASCGRFHKNIFFRFWLNCQPIRHCIPELRKINWLFIVLHKDFGAKSKFGKKKTITKPRRGLQKTRYLNIETDNNQLEWAYEKNWNFWSCFIIIMCGIDIILKPLTYSWYTTLCSLYAVRWRRPQYMLKNRRMRSIDPRHFNHMACTKLISGSFHEVRPDVDDTHTNKQTKIIIMWQLVVLSTNL